jgi:prepilin-type N-terminal cleavage/methylation domain-containing protein
MRSRRAGKGSRSAGFTMVEVLVVLVISAAVLAFAYSFLTKGLDATRAGEDHATVQQNLRVAGEMLSDQIRMAGYGIDFGNGQQGLVHAGPWDIIFNANLNPDPDVFGDPRPPGALDPSVTPSSVPAAGTVLYAPTRAFGTGAETIRISLDSDDDGVITDADRGDDDEEVDGGDRDYVLCRYVYGSDSLGSNDGVKEKVAVCVGPDADEPPTPVFQYLYDDDDDPTTALLLWGDDSGNLVLEATEIENLTEMPSALLPYVRRVRVLLTGDSQRMASDAAAAASLPSWEFRTEVTLRNRPRTLATIRGVVFQDDNGDATFNLGETGVANARIQLNTGARVMTRSDGVYSFEVDPGSFTVTETDPSGYTSTTPNTMAASVAPGAVEVVNFGDRPIDGSGWVSGMVWSDANGNAAIDGGEWGISDVVVYLNTGARDTTDANGEFSFFVPVTSYTVTEIDSAGYISTTPNQVDVTIEASGDTALAFFGDQSQDGVGTLSGTVYEDDNENQAQDAGEVGIAQVRILLDTGDSTRTDSDGFYSFSLLPGLYDVTEVDPEEYVSTTPNDVTDVEVVADSTTTVDFGDKTSAELNFDEIILSNTDRALSVKAADFNEDGRSDPDILLGTRFVSGLNNILGYHSSWVNANTPNSSIFSGTATYTRSGNADVTTIGLASLNGDAFIDVVTGLYATTSNIKSWLTLTAGGNRGKMPNSPNYTYSTSIGAEVLCLLLADVKGSTDIDLIVGTRTATGQGRIEVWTGNGAGAFSIGVSDYIILNSLGSALGEPMSIAAGQLDGSGGMDLAVATMTSSYAGRLEILFQTGSSGLFLPSRTYTMSGQANAVALVNMLEDSNNDVDVLVGTSTGANMGEIELWLNDGSGNFGDFDAVDSSWVRSDSTVAAGEVLSLASALVNPDVYPDVCTGTKTSSAYQGSLQVYLGFGFLPSSGTEWSGSEIGEVTTLDTSDFNKDGKTDIVVGTRTSSTSGKLVVYFQQ